jgi:hypothetical protein
MSEHRYYVVFDNDAAPWDPHDASDLPLPDCAYFGGVFRTLERHWRGDPLTVYMTKDTTSLPGYGRDVVSVLLNEEWFRTPAYSSTILAVLRNLPGRPWFPWGTLAPPSLSATFAVANYLRVRAERNRSHREGEAIRQERGWPAPRTDNTIDVPLGYYRQPEKPIKPVQERATDVYFGGSLVHDLGRKERWKQIVKRLAGNPKQLYRKSMLRELERVRCRHPEITAKVTLTGEFRELESAQVSDYASDMMDARVALVPRGTAAESYRLFEAWRYGCIVVCEPLPPRWFLEGAPVISLGSWRELERVLVSLFEDPARQRELHESSLRWWRHVCSEEAVGRRLASQLRGLSAA